jgi:hypothetical protein
MSEGHVWEERRDYTGGWQVEKAIHSLIYYRATYSPSGDDS